MQNRTLDGVRRLGGIAAILSMLGAISCDAKNDPDGGDGGSTGSGDTGPTGGTDTSTGSGNAGPTVASFTLIDAGTGQPVAGFDPIADGATVPLAELPEHVSLRANTSPSGVGSVTVSLDGVSHTDGQSPYSLCGDDGSSFDDCAALHAPGAHTVIGTAFSDAEGKGTSGPPLTLDFQITIGDDTGHPPTTGYVGGVGLDDVGIANYATYVLVNGKAQYWGYAIGGGITTDPANIPVDDGTTLVRISAGGHSNMALDSTGHVWGSGGNIMGEMGIGSVGGLHEFYTEWVPTPVDDQGADFGHVVDIQEGFDGSSALKDDGTLWFWGLNGDDGAPVTSPGGGGMTGITGMPAPTTGCPWGGDPNADPNCYTTRPHRIEFPANDDGSEVFITRYSYGMSTPLALDARGNVWAWGSNALVDGDFARSLTPVKVKIDLLPEGEKIVDISSSGSFFYALGSDGHLYGWASGSGGTKLGIGDGVYNWHPTPTPIDVTAQPAFTFLVGKIAKIVAGGPATYVIDTDNNLWAWGSQVIGSVGNGPTGISQGIGIDIPNSWNWSTDVAMVMEPTKVLEHVHNLYVRGYVYNAFAITDDGTLYGWGRDKFGNIGDGCVGDDYPNAQVDICDVGTPKSVTPL